MASGKAYAAPVYVIDGLRTPFLRAQGKPGPFSAADLAVHAGKALLLRQPFAANALDEVILGCVAPGPYEANIARIVALRLGCGAHMPAFTVQRNCASGMQALDSAAMNIAHGRADLMLVGGVESMSHAPILFNRNMVDWLGGLFKCRTLGAKLKHVTRFRPNFLAPVIGLKCGLSDPLLDISMGQTAQNVAYRFQIPRADMDGYAQHSHKRLASAQENSLLDDEITPIFDAQGNLYTQDEGVRPDTTTEKLRTLKPVFDRSGDITAGNSAQVTDGAAMLILASEQAVKDHQLPVLGVIRDTQWAALDSAMMGLGPVHAIPPLLQRANLTPEQIHYWEINEAFAAQVLGCLAAWRDADYCREELGLAQPFGDIGRDHLNIDGGGISLGHPVGASGARIVLHLLQVLKRNNARTGVAALCIGVGQGGAMLIERETE